MQYIIKKVQKFIYIIYISKKNYNNFLPSTKIKNEKYNYVIKLQININNINIVLISINNHSNLLIQNLSNL